jgi:hypothetical protein
MTEEYSMENNNPLSWKTSWKHAVLEYQIKELDTSQDLSRSAITSRAIVEGVKVPDWRVPKEKLALITRMNIPIPASMQAKLDEEASELLQDIRTKILCDFEGELERLQTPYMIQLLWVNYLEVLKQKALTVGVEKKDKDDLTGPDMVKRLVQILLLNRDADAQIIEKIKNDLLEWEE